MSLFVSGFPSFFVKSCTGIVSGTILLFGGKKMAGIKVFGYQIEDPLPKSRFSRLITYFLSYLGGYKTSRLTATVVLKSP